MSDLTKEQVIDWLSGQSVLEIAGLVKDLEPAVHEGYIARSEGRTLEIGFLVMVVGLEIQPVTLRAGECLQIHARRTRGRPGLGVVSHRCTVHRRSDDDQLEIIADGRLSIAIKGLRTGEITGGERTASARPRKRSD